MTIIKIKTKKNGKLISKSYRIKTDEDIPKYIMMSDPNIKSIVNDKNEIVALVDSNGQILDLYSDYTYNGDTQWKVRD